MTDLALSLRGVRKSYGSRRALDGLDLTVPAGVVYGFLGPNGSGKTTTIRLLPRPGPRQAGAPSPSRHRLPLVSRLPRWRAASLPWLVGALVVAVGFSERAEVLG